MSTNKLLFSKKESAHILGVSLRTLDNLISAKELHVRRIGRRVFVRSTTLEQFVRRDHATTSGTNYDRSVNISTDTASNSSSDEGKKRIQELFAEWERSQSHRLNKPLASLDQIRREDV